MKQKNLIVGITFVALLALVCIASAQPFAYIANYNGNTISVVDLATNTVTGTITANVGQGPNGVAVSPDGSTVYVTNSLGNSISVIKAGSPSVVTATIAVGTAPQGIAVSPDGKYVYVANYGNAANNGGNTVSVIQTSTNTIIATVPVGTKPYGLAVTPDNSAVYVADSGTTTVSVIQTSTNTATATITVGTKPMDVAVSPDGSTVYVTNQGSNTISVINAKSNVVTATIPNWPGAANPIGLATSPEGNTLYVADSNGWVTVIDINPNSATFNTPTWGVNTLGAPYGIEVSPDGKYLYVTNEGGVNQLLIFDTEQPNPHQILADVAMPFIPGFNSPASLGKFIGPAPSGTSQSNFQFTTQLTAGQNTQVTNSNPALPGITQGVIQTLPGIFTLHNSGGHSAKVEAAFTSHVGLTYGLLSATGAGTSILEAKYFSMGPTGGTLVPLKSDGSLATIMPSTAPLAPGATVVLDGKLDVPSTQTPGAYAGTIILIFSNA